MDACTTQLKAQKRKPTITRDWSHVKKASNLTTKYHEGNETMTLNVAYRLSLFEAGLGVHVRKGKRIIRHDMASAIPPRTVFGERITTG